MVRFWVRRTSRIWSHFYFSKLVRICVIFHHSNMKTMIYMNTLVYLDRHSESFIFRRHTWFLALGCTSWKAPACSCGLAPWSKSPWAPDGRRGGRWGSRPFWPPSGRSETALSGIGSFSQSGTGALLSFARLGCKLCSAPQGTPWQVHSGTAGF